MNNEAEMRELDVALSDVEVAQKSDALARITAEIADVEEEKNKATRGFSVKLKDMKRRQSELARNVVKREEMRLIPCYERADLRRCIMEVFRSDNGKAIDTRAMTKEELEDARQMNLGLPNDPPKPIRVADGGGGLPIKSEGFVPPDVSALKSPPGEKLSDVAAALAEEDEHAITNPEDMLNGKQAKKAKKAEADAHKPKRRSRKGGLNLGAEGEEMPPATPTTTIGVAAIVNEERCLAPMNPDDPTSPRCTLLAGHPVNEDHEASGIVWPNVGAAEPELGADASDEALAALSEDETMPTDGGDDGEA